MDFAYVLLGWAAIVVVCMLIVAFLASRWGRDPFGWLLLTAALGPIAIIALIGTHQRDLEHPEASEQRGPATGRQANKVVLVASDGSAQGERAARYVANEFKDAGEVLVVTVLPHEARPRENDDVALRQHETHVDERVGRSMDTLRSAGLPTRVVVAYGSAGEEILRAADAGHASTIVVGRRGAGLTKALLGSVSDYVVKNAKQPVVLVD